MLQFICFYLLFGIATATEARRRVHVDVDATNKSFTITVGGGDPTGIQTSWFRSGEVFFRSANKLYSTIDGSLNLASVSSEAASNRELGDFLKYTLTYETVDDDKQMVGDIWVFDDFIVFDQHFPQTLTECSAGNADALVSGFPSFTMQNSDSGSSEHTSAAVGYAHWVSWFYETVSVEENHRRALVAPGFQSPTFGLWDESTSVLGGIGGSGVTCVYDERDETAVVLSPMENVMAMSHYSPTPGTYQMGVMGNVTVVPRDISFKTMMYVGLDGINEAMAGWGAIMRKYHHKQSAAEARTSDVTLQYLGFTTDNGAYYYYNTEPSKDYEQTLLDVKAYADSEGIPYKYVLLDSWWYYKGKNGGVSDWMAMPDVFPNGIEALYNRTGWFVQAHNRYWALDNVYSKTNGGSFEFVEDPVKDGAVPVQQSLWEKLLDAPVNDWGLVVYEQDWLFNEFYEYVGQMLESVSLGRLWLTQMGAVAAQKGITIQYCMPYIRHLLMSLEVSAVTQARASDDYVVAPYDGVDVQNWRIGGQTLLLEALGLASSKDGFWSTGYQPGNPYGEERFEPYPRLESAVATLSAGPVAIADGISYSDAALIMKSCAKVTTEYVHFLFTLCNHAFNPNVCCSTSFSKRIILLSNNSLTFTMSRAVDSCSRQHQQ